MGTLNQNDLQFIHLAYYQGLTHAEIQAHTDTPLGTVKSWIRRGLQRLKGCLNNELS
jgi:DNA-directed RNA polymerase specialized sigma24 family protein